MGDTRVMRAGVLDIVNGVRTFPIWSRLSMRAVHYSYRRTFLGPWWHALDQLLFTGGFAFLSLWLFGGSLEERIAYVGLGILVFGLISQLVNAGSYCFVSNTSLRNSRLPISARLLKDQFNAYVTFAHRVVVMFPLLYLVGVNYGLGSLWAIPGLLLTAIWGVGVGLVLGPLCARYRDMIPLIGLLLRLAMFATPVFWHASNGSSVESLNTLSRFNPFATFLDVVRSPILEGQLDTTLLVRASVLASTALLAGVLIFSSTRRYVNYWA